MRAIAAILVALAAPRIDAGQPSARDRARAVLAGARCDQCHDRTVSTGHPRALAVFDLHDDEWSARMSSKQLRKLLTRLQGAPAGDREVVVWFVDEQVRRKSTAR